MPEIQETITYTNEFGSVSVGVTKECAHIDDMINDLVRPLLKAAGFTDQTVADALGQY